MSTILNSLSDPRRWKIKRDACLECARDCREIAIRRENSPEVIKRAVQFWVTRARRAHAIFMGREAIIDGMAVISGVTMEQGALYARRP